MRRPPRDPLARARLDAAYGVSAPARHVIAVGSGKGGVGKSTVSLNLALALRERRARIGLLDADFYGPNIPLMVGLTREQWQGDWELAGRREQAPMPPIERYGLQIMSAGFIIADDQPLILDGQTIPFLLRQLVQRTAWGDLEYLVIDLPPGTADIQQTLLRTVALSGAIVVVTPQDAAHLDARKAIQMFRRAGVRVLGGIENMSGFACPHCHEPIDVFPRVAPNRAIWSLDVECLGSIPLDQTVGGSADAAAPLLVEHPTSPPALAIANIAERVLARLTSLDS